MAKTHLSNDVCISDDDFTDEELACIYGIDKGCIPGTDPYEEQVERELERTGVWG